MMPKRSEVDPDGWRDDRMDRIAEAQTDCPYFQKLDRVPDLDDDRLCLIDKRPCSARRFCPVDRW